MDIVNTGRKIFLNAYNEFGEKELLKGNNSEKTINYIKKLSDDEKLALTHYICREYITKGLNNKPILAKFFEAAKVAIPNNLNRFIKQVEFEYILSGKIKDNEKENYTDDENDI